MASIPKYTHGSKYYFDKDFRALAWVWWRSLSINEMKAFESKHNTIGDSASAAEIAAIYDFEVDSKTKKN